MLKWRETFLATIRAKNIRTIVTGYRKAIYSKSDILVLLNNQ